MFRPTWCTVVADIVTFVLACSFALQAQNATPPHPPRPKVVGPAKWAPSAQQVSVAYWTLEPGRSTTIEMRNNVAYHDLTVTPVLRAETGEETALAPITIAPQHIVSLDLGNAIAQIGKNIGSFGSAVFRFDGLNAENLFAATIVQHVGEPIDFHFDGRDASLTLNSSGVEGMWWIPSASSTDYLILSNPLGRTVKGSLILSSGFASHRPLAISLGPGQIKRIDVREVLGVSSNGGLGGITLTLPNKELIWVTQIVFDETTGFSAMMKMFERLPDDKAEQRILRAPMMAMMQPDSALGFPTGTTLVPQMFLRNASSSAMQVKAAIDWHDQNFGTFTLPIFSLAPGEVKTIRLTDYQQAGIPSDANWATVRVSYEGQRADLVAIAASYDRTDRYGLQTPFSEDLSRLWAGGMWHVDPTHNSLITTGNGGSEPTTAEVTLFYNGGKSKYRSEKMLAPGQQLWLDVGHLIHDQVADSDGNTLSPDTMSGSYELKDLDHGYVGQLYEGKLVIDKTYGHAAYGCGACCGYTVPQFDPTSFFGAVNIDGGETINSNDACLGGLVDVSGDANSWGSSDTAVATLSKATIHTVASGTATGNAELKLQWAHPPACPTEPFEPQQGITVCDFTVGPSTVYAQDCTGKTQNSNNFNATIAPSSCVADSAKSKCAAKWVSGNLEIVGATCVFNLGPPAAQVTYFAGPKLPNGSAGTFETTFDIYFDTLGTDVARYVTATAQCP